MPAADDAPRIAILGAGPIGLETALYARYLGYPVHLFERAATPAANVLAWGHVTLFTPFGRNVSPLGVAALEAQDANWKCPAVDTYLTGAEHHRCYWLPLAKSDLLAGVLQCGTEVLGIGRTGWLKREGVGKPERGNAPFQLLLRESDGTENAAHFEIVIDCTGTYGHHNRLGQGGIPAPGELAAAERIEYGLPDVCSDDKNQYLGKRILLVGAGYSAATVVTNLARLGGDTHVTWITRDEHSAPIQRIENDRLAVRDELAKLANAIAGGETASVVHRAATSIVALEYRAGSDDFEVELSGQQHGKFVFDRIIANVGYHPDRRIYHELQVHECYATEGPMKLAAQLMAQSGNSADCLDQTSCGPASLLNPEPSFYILGSKSYGRNSQFLLSIGLEQIRDVFTIIGDREDLDLYATMPALC